MMTASEMHLESHPRKFHTRAEYGTEASKRSAPIFEAMCERAEGLTPADAVRLAQRLLVHVDAAGIDYAEFQSAQATQKYVRKAIAALRGLPLS